MAPRGTGLAVAKESWHATRSRLVPPRSRAAGTGISLHPAQRGRYLPVEKYSRFTGTTNSRRLRFGRLRDAHRVARGVPERAVARAPGLVDGLLQHLGAGGPHLLEGRAEIAGAEDDHRQDALGEQFLQGIAVGLGPARVRLGEHDLQVRLGRAGQGDPAEPVRGDVVAHLKAERVAVEGERGVQVVDGDVAVLE